MSIDLWASGIIGHRLSVGETGRPWSVEEPHGVRAPRDAVQERTSGLPDGIRVRSEGDDPGHDSMHGRGS